MRLVRYVSIDIKYEKKSCSLTENFFPFDMKLLFFTEDTKK